MTSFNKALWFMCATLCTQLFGDMHGIHVYINNHTHLKFDISVKHQGTGLVYENDWKTQSKVLEPFQENTAANMILTINSYLPQGVHLFTITLDDGIQKIRLTQKFTSKSLDMPCYIELQPTDCLIKLVTHQDQPIYILCTTQGLNIIYWIIEKLTHDSEQTASIINSQPQCSEKHSIKITHNKNQPSSHEKDDNLDYDRQNFIRISALEILAALITTPNKTQCALRNDQEHPEELQQKDCPHCSSSMNSMLGKYIIKTSPDMLNIVEKKHSSTETGNVHRFHTFKEQL